MVDMSKVSVADYCVTIKDSYEVSKKEFQNYLNEIRSEYTDKPVLNNRSDCSFKNEWACHNFLYICHIARSRTKDTYMQYPLTWWEKIIYPLCGWLCKIFIK